MYVRRDNIVAIVLAAAIAVLFWVLPYQIKTIPVWVACAVDGICGLVIIVSILIITPIWGKIFSKKVTTPLPIIEELPDINYINTIRITSPEPSRRFPLLGDIVGVTCTILTLAFGSFEIDQWIIGRLLIHDYFRWYLFLIIYVILPLWYLWDTLTVERKQLKLGRSRVAKEKTITFRDDVEVVFNRCVQAISMMRFSIIALTKPKIIKAQRQSSLLTVTITNLGHKTVNVNMLSDAVWTTVKFDFGKNQRIINTFERLIQPKPEKEKIVSER